MAQTILATLINPQVMADMISAELPKMIKISPLATIDNTLVAQPGNTITTPAYVYIGDAADVAEGIAIGTTVLTASSVAATVKKAAIGVEITDESALSGYGDPIGEANSQLLKSIAAKVDNDCLAALGTATLVHDGSLAIISYNGIVDAVDKFQEEDYEDKVLFVHPSQVAQIRKDVDFKNINQYPLETVMTGVIGSIAGCQVVPSKKISNAVTYTNFIVKKKALTIYMKRDVNVETDRDILKKTTVITADEHYVAVLSNASKAIKATFKLV